MVISVSHLTDQVEIRGGGHARILSAVRGPAFPPAGPPTPVAASDSCTLTPLRGYDDPFQFQQLYELSNFLILATIARFYMTTQRTLSAATLARGRRYALNSSFQSRVSSLLILIANARLEFSVSHREKSPLKIPNRERLAIFHSPSSTAPLDFLSPLI